MADVAGPAVSFGSRERLHEMPTGKIGARDVADFAATDQCIESVERFFDGGQGIETVQMVDVEVIRVEAAEAGFAGLEDVVARRADVVGTVAEAESGFGGDEKIVALACDGFAENFF